MNKLSPLISICIPTYNGANTIEKTLNAIVSQISNDFEIILCDDASSDNTVEIINKIKSQFNCVKLFHNKKNLGMDGNFHRTTQLAKGRYIWFCGQDDIFCDGALQQVQRMIKSNKDIGILNLNFSQYDHDIKNCLIESFFDVSTFDQKLVKENKELYFNTPRDYYKIFTQPPSFLPSVVMLKEYWTITNVKQFYGTFFIQVGVLLLNMHKNRIGVFTVPLIKGRIPDDQWQQDGNKLFLIMTGDLEAKKIAFEINKNLPFEIYKRDRLKYLLNYIFLIYKCKISGLKSSPDFVIKLKTIFAGSFYAYIYVMILFYTPTILLSMLVLPGKFIKKLIFMTRISDIRR